MDFNLIGAGRLGRVIAKALLDSGKAALGAVCNAHFHKAREAIRQLGSGVAVPHLLDLPPADLTFITTPDDQILQLAKQLAEQGILRPGSTVVHCSAVLSTTALAPLKAKGCHLASFHPLKAFAKGTRAKQVFQGCDCSIEGDEQAVQLVSALFNPLGVRMIRLEAAAKSTYHAAAVIAANYLVTLAATAIELFEEAGISADLAKQLTTQLMGSSLTNIQQTKRLSHALTGPLQRGDLNTVSQHLTALSKPSTKTLYRSAALATLPLTNLPDELKEQLQVLLQS